MNRGNAARIPESQAEPVDAIVVGGGIGGLSTALALAKVGLQTRVLEQAPRFGEVGAGLQMAPNATRILRDWGLLDEVIEMGVTPRRLVMRDAMDGRELTMLDLVDAQERYGAPYVVLHRSDLHSILLNACQRAGVDLVTGCEVTSLAQSAESATALSKSRSDTGHVVVAADGLSSRLRALISSDEPVSSAFVAYRGAIPIDEIKDEKGISLTDVVVYIGPGRHFVQYPLRRGEMFNQVAVFRSPKALAGLTDWGTPDELDEAFAGSCAQVMAGIPHLWLDRWWNMYDRDPISSWVKGRMVLTGDAAHPMLQYLAQGACQAIEDAAELSHQVSEHRGNGRFDWPVALEHYARIRTARTARVQANARAWGEFWHCDGAERERRNKLLRERDVYDYTHVDWFYAEQTAASVP